MVTFWFVSKKTVYTHVFRSSEIGSLVQQGLLKSEVQMSDITLKFLRLCYCSLIMFWNITCWYFVVFRNWKPALIRCFTNIQFIWMGSRRCCLTCIFWPVSDMAFEPMVVGKYTLGITNPLVQVDFEEHNFFFFFFFLSQILEKCFHKTNAGEKNNHQVWFKLNIAFC